MIKLQQANLNSLDNEYFLFILSFLINYSNTNNHEN